MSTFDSRNLGYKAGVILLLVATVLFIIGFATPYWSQAENTFSARIFSVNYTYTETFNEGLWMMCVSGEVVLLSAHGCGYHGVIGFRECCCHYF